MDAGAAALADQGQGLTEVGDGSGPASHGRPCPLELSQASLDPRSELGHSGRGLPRGRPPGQDDLDPPHVIHGDPHSPGPR